MNSEERRKKVQEYLNSESDRIEALYDERALNDSEYVNQLDNAYIETDELNNRLVAEQKRREDLADIYLSHESDRIEDLYDARTLNDEEYVNTLNTANTIADLLAGRKTNTDGLTSTEIIKNAQEYLERESFRIEKEYDERKLDDDKYAKELGDATIITDTIKSSIKNLPNNEKEEMAISEQVSKDNAPVQENINFEEELRLEKEKAQKAERDYQDSIAEFQRIFAEERENIDKMGPFKTTEEYDAFLAEYMNKKVAEDKRFNEAKGRLQESRTKIAALENKLDQINVVRHQNAQAIKKESPKTIALPAGTIENITNRSESMPQMLKNDNPNKTLNDRKTPSAPPLIEMKESPLKIAGPVLGEERLGLPGPVLGEEPLGLPGPVTKEEAKLPPKSTETSNNETTTKEDGTNPKLAGTGATPKKGLMTILEEVTKGLSVSRKDGKRYRASNIRVRDTFKNELRTGNYLYNIVHIVPTLIKIPVQLFTKLSSKIMYRQKARERIETIKERLDILPEEDLMTIYKEYRAGKVNQERFPTALNTLLNERIERFAMDKVREINTNLEAQYSDIFATVNQLEAVDNILKEENISDADKIKLQNYRQQLLTGKAGEVASIRNNYIEANNWLSGGLHGFSEDMKASATKLSCVGKRFAKDHDLDLSLLKKEAVLERAEMNAIASGDDETALKAFVQAESLLSANTEIKNSIFGKRSTGKKYYSPLAEKLDYRDDPFIRDLFTTVAVTSAAISATNALRVHNDEAKKVLAQQQHEASAVNNLNNQKMAEINQTGIDITDNRVDMMEGMKAQSEINVLSSANEVERATLDKSNWGLGTNEYHSYDASGHDFYNVFYEETASSIQEVASKYASSSISEQQAMQMLSDISKETNATFQNVTTECLNILKPYAESHPQFDLSGVENAMSYLVQHPDAITKMNEAMLETTALGENLIGLTATQVTALTSLPSDLQETLFGAASAGALAYRVSSTMEANKNRGKYGNEVTEMVNEYVNNTTATVAETTTSKH